MSSIRLTPLQRETLAKIAGWDDVCRQNLSVIVSHGKSAKKLIAIGLVEVRGVVLYVTDSGREWLRGHS